MPRPSQSGLSFIELLVCLAITGILLSVVLPSMNEWVQRTRLQSAADLLKSDLQEARSVAIRQQSDVQVHFESDDNGTCVIVHDGMPGDCQCAVVDHQPQCAAPSRALRTQWLPSSQQFTVRSNVKEMRFITGQGIVTPTATVTLRDEHGHAIDVITSTAGRTRLCAKGTRFGGLPLCLAT